MELEKGTGNWVKFLVDRIQTPVKRILNTFNVGGLNLMDAFMALEILKSLEKLPETTKENTRELNTVRLIDIKNEFFKHIDAPDYDNIFRFLFNFLITKYDYDRFYQGLMDWFVGELIKSGWRLPEENYPHSRLWKL